MLIGYARVSTEDQVLDLQTDALHAAGCERVYDDVVSGSTTSRPGLDQALDMLRGGDVLVVWKLDRVGRSLKHLVELVTDLEERGVGFRVLTGDIDTTTPAGRLVFHLFAALAEFERDLIRERTMAGLKAARTRGRVGGRRPKMTPKKVRLAMTLLADRTLTLLEICETLEVSKWTLYNYVSPQGELRERGQRMLGVA